MINQVEIKNFQDRFNSLWSFVKKSKGNEGFIENLVTRLMVFLETSPLTKELIESWRVSLEEDGKLLRKAYVELAQSIEQIRQSSQNDQSVLEFLESTLEEVRKSGSCAFLKEVPYPYDVVYYRLRSLYSN